MFIKLYTPFLLGMLLLLPAIQLRAQECKCDCSRPDYRAPIGIMIDHPHARGEWMVSYRYMNMQMQGNRMGTQDLSAVSVYNSYLMRPVKMSMQMHMIMAMYGVSDRVTVMGMAGYVRNAMNMSMWMYGGMSMDSSGHMHGGGSSEMESAMTASGFSDPQVYVLYSLMNKENHQILLSAGIGIPAGNLSLGGKDMLESYRRYSYSMQTGTGSWVILPGITYTGQSHSYSWGVQFVSEVKTGINKYGYKTGNVFTSSAWFARKWTDWLSSSLRLQGSMQGSIKGFDPEIARHRTEDPGADARNSGNVQANVLAGFNFHIPGFLPGSAFGIEAGIPVYQYVQGMQMKSSAMLNAGIHYVF